MLLHWSAVQRHIVKAIAAPYIYNSGNQKGREYGFAFVHGRTAAVAPKPGSWLNYTVAAAFAHQSWGMVGAGLGTQTGRRPCGSATRYVGGPSVRRANDGTRDL
jgi:hypothetical protein